MATRSVVPRATGEGGLGTTLLRWATAFINAITCTTINALTLAAAAVGFTISGGTTPKTLTVPATITLPDILAAGALPYGSAAGVLSSLVGGAANLRLFMNASGTTPEWAIGIKLATFTRDTAAASGTQAITGVGFKPSHVIFLAAVYATTEASIGLDNGTSHCALVNRYALAANTWAIDGTDSILLFQTSEILYEGKVTTLGADGFTVTWIKTGAKTGTATVVYIAFR